MHVKRSVTYTVRHALKSPNPAWFIELVGVSGLLCSVCVNTDCCGSLDVRVSAGREKGVMGDLSTDGSHIPLFSV